MSCLSQTLAISPQKLHQSFKKSHGEPNSFADIVRKKIYSNYSPIEICKRISSFNDSFQQRNSDSLILKLAKTKLLTFQSVCYRILLLDVKIVIRKILRTRLHSARDVMLKFARNVLTNCTVLNASSFKIIKSA